MPALGIGDSLLQAGSQTASNAIGIGIQRIGRNYDDRKQMQQARRLTDLQVKNEMKLGEFNQAQALDLWEKTGYEAQRRHMEAAGLNVGLMYKSGGSTGQTVGGQAGSVSSQSTQGGQPTRTDGMGLMLGAQLQNILADVELKKAEAEKAREEAKNQAGGIRQKLGAETANIRALTANTEIQNEGIQWDNRIKEIQATIMSKTTQESIDAVQMANQKLQAEVEIAKNNKKISDEVMNETIKQAKIQSATMLIEQELKKAQIGNIMMDTVATKMKNVREEGAQQLAFTMADFAQDQEFNKMTEGDKNRAMSIINTVVGAIVKGK